MSNLTVYLAGPITGHTYDGCTEWREAAKVELEREATGRLNPDAMMPPREVLIPEYRPSGILALSPMRTKEHLQSTGPIPATSALYDDSYVVERDLMDVRRSDVILMNLLGAERVSIGTMCELGYAKALNKFTVVVMERTLTIGEESAQAAGLAAFAENNPHEHLFVYHLASVVVPTLEEAIQIVKGL